MNELPGSMNGSAPFLDTAGVVTPFTVVLPTSGFTLDLRLSAGDDFPDPDSLQVWCNVPLGGGSSAGGRDPGDALSDLFQPEPPLRFSWRVPVSLSMPATWPAAAVTCSASVSDLAGRESAVATLAFGTAVATPEIEPFDDEDLWVLDFSRDLFAVAPLILPDGSYSIATVDGGNGIPDHLEEMAVIGLQGSESAPGAATLLVDGSVGVNAVVGRKIRRALLERVRGYFHRAPDGTGSEHSVGATFILNDDPAAPDTATFDPGGTFSIIGIGGEGSLEDRMTPVFGRAQLDPRNTVRNDNSPFGRGVFTATAIRAVLAIDIAVGVLAPIIPALGGVALGDHPSDPIFLADGFDPDAPGVTKETRDRAALYATITALLVKALGALTAHEIGHSLGLVANGPPPYGLFGGETLAEFAYDLTNPGHLDTEGLNIMASGGGGAGLKAAASLLEEPFFGPMNLAYLRGRLWVLEP